MRRKIGRPAKIRCEPLVFGSRDTEQTHESHDRTNRPLDVDAVISVNRDEAGLAPERRKVDKGPVVVHDLLDVLEAVGEHPVELARQDGRVARDDAFTLRRRATKVQSESPTPQEYQSATDLVQRDLEEHVARALHAEELAGDKDQVLLREEAEVLLADDARQRSREVNVGRRLLLDGLDDTSLATGDGVVELVVDLADFGMEAAQLIEEDEQSDAGLLDTLVRARDDDLDVALRLEPEPDRGVCLSDDREVRLGQSGDLVELAAHLDFDVLFAVEDFGAGHFDDRLSLHKSDRASDRPSVPELAKRATFSTTHQERALAEDVTSRGHDLLVTPAQVDIVEFPAPVLCRGARRTLGLRARRGRERHRCADDR